MEHKIIFSTTAYQYLRNELAGLARCLVGEVLSREFPDGEIYHRLLHDVSGMDVLLIGGTLDDRNTMELYDLAQGLAHANANSLSIVIPYFGYSTMERAVEKGEIVKAKNRALMFSSIPMCAETNKVYLLDLHSEGIPYYFDRDIHSTHIYCKKLIMEAASELAGTDFVMASTDAGRAKWVESLANEMGIRSAFVYKHRLSGSETQITGVNADVKGKKIVIYDDMIRTGVSLMKAAEAYQKQGADEIYAIATHGLFTNNALTKIKDQGIIRNVVSSNTHPQALLHQGEFLQVKSVAGIIFDYLND